MEKWKIGWGVSNRCNMHCRFCYSSNARKEPDYENNIREGLRFILQNKDRIDSINFGTGEPTLEPELFSLCDAIRREAPGISIGITTNGTLSEAVNDPYKLEVFIRCIDDVDISLDYGDPARQDKSRNYKGAFRMAVRSLELCQKHGKNASIVNAMHRYNGTVQNLDALMRLARIFGSSLRINIYRPTVGFDFALDSRQLKELLLHLVKHYKIESLADPLFASLFRVPCPAGDPVAKSSFRILPNGYISPSTYLLDKEWQTCRIDEIDEIDALHQYEGFTRILDAPLPDDCGSCALRDTCLGGVIDRRWLWYKDLKERDPYCPLRSGDDTDWTALTGEPVLSKEKKSFVHDGYLPTLIFHPALNERQAGRWDAIYAHSIEEYGSMEPEPEMAELRLLLPSGAKVLDLGSGLGRNGLYFLRDGYDVTFADSSKTANDHLLRTILEEMPTALYRVLDADAAYVLASLEEGSADAVLAIHVVSHGTPEKIRHDYADGLHRVLKSGGLAAVTLPSLRDGRCSRHLEAGSGGLQDPEAGSGIVSFPLTDGPEKGIVHTFYSKEAVLALFGSFEILKTEERFSGENAHWHLLMRKSSCIRSTG